MEYTFKDLGITDPILSALENNGFTKPTPIQAQTIPILLNGKKDIVAQAQTGTGKTAAFGLPILQQLQPERNTVQALILTPTRELCLQIHTQLNVLKGSKALKIAAIYGGDSIERQARMLKDGVDIVVGTPGRVIDHMERKRLKLDQLSYLILDEADEMLTIGFLEEVEKIMAQTPRDKNTLLFSATMPEHILNLAEKYMNEYDRVKVAKTTASQSLTEQFYYFIKEHDKLALLKRIIDSVDEFYGFIFCKTKRDVDSITDKLIKQGYEAESLHGDLSQNQRERVLLKFRAKKCDILVVTDVAARGIDVSGLSHVINFAIPQDKETYTHRIGRTGRAGKSGTAITFVSPTDQRRWNLFLRGLNMQINPGELPSAEEIIKAKKKEIVSKFGQMNIETLPKAYFHVAKTILESEDPVEALAKALKKAYPTSLDEKQFESIQLGSARSDRNGRGDDRSDRGPRGERGERGERGDRGDRGQRSGQIQRNVRLMIQKGRKDQLGPKKMIQEISRVSRVPDRFIDDLEIKDSVSYFYTSKQDAEKIIRAFQGKGQKPLVTLADRS